MRDFLPPPFSFCLFFNSFVQKSIRSSSNPMADVAAAVFRGGAVAVLGITESRDFGVCAMRVLVRSGCRVIRLCSGAFRSTEPSLTSALSLFTPPLLLLTLFFSRSRGSALLRHRPLPSRGRKWHQPTVLPLPEFDPRRCGIRGRALLSPPARS